MSQIDRSKLIYLTTGHLAWCSRIRSLALATLNGSMTIVRGRLQCYTALNPSASDVLKKEKKKRYRGLEWYSFRRSFVKE